MLPSLNAHKLQTFLPLHADALDKLNLVEGRPYFDFLGNAVLDAGANLQKKLYERDNTMNYVARDGEARNFMSEFVQDRLTGRVHGKDRMLMKKMRSLALPNDALIVELGCNDGRYLQLATKLFSCRGLGLDLSETAIRRAVASSDPKPNQEQPVSGPQALFGVCDVTCVPLESGSVDAILSFDVFEHLSHLGFMKVMEEMLRLLKPGARFLTYMVSQKDAYTFHESLRRISGGRAGNDCDEGHSYENFIHPDFFRSIASETGLKLDRIDAYHAFWTLANDELFHTRSKLLQTLFHLLDWPLHFFEYGNGFFAEGFKA